MCFEGAHSSFTWVWPAVCEVAVWSSQGHIKLLKVARCALGSALYSPVMSRFNSPAVPHTITVHLNDGRYRLHHVASMVYTVTLQFISTLHISTVLTTHTHTQHTHSCCFLGEIGSINIADNMATHYCTWPASMAMAN